MREPAGTPPGQDLRSSLTTLAEVRRALADEPARGFSAWARTTAGVVALLFVLQLVTGLLLAFVYVPSSAAAHATVAYVEKVVPAGSWLRALHHCVSQLLPLALLLHLAQMYWRGAHRRKFVGWAGSVLLLALALAAAATGYSLPWDARAFYSTRVAEGVAGGLPLIGEQARRWLLGGARVSTLTLSRLYALHAFVTPLLILTVVVARLFIFRERQAPAAKNLPGARPSSSDEVTTNEAAAFTASPERRWLRVQFARNAVVVGLVFLGLAVFAAKYSAPLGPPPAEAEPGYLPRPGFQFLWLFQLLKYMPAPLASTVALLLPASIFGALLLLPFFDARGRGESPSLLRRYAGAGVFAFILLLTGTLTTIALLEDARDPRVREQLARQAREEQDFRRAPFQPLRLEGEDAAGDGAAQTAPGPDGPPAAADEGAPPAAYAAHCARCHGARGEGRFANPPLAGVGRRPRRTLEDIVAILDDPASYGLEARMPSFRGKLTDEEKRQIAAWVVSLRP